MVKNHKSYHLKRYRNIDLPQRICQVCNTEVEDEIHLLLTCKAYTKQRETLFKKAAEFDNTFCEQEDLEKFTFLMSNLQKPVIKFLTSAIAIRTNILTLPNPN